MAPAEGGEMGEGDNPGKESGEDVAGEEGVLGWGLGAAYKGMFMK